ncbi:MAG: c-type cytochrome [Dokdonella sp.]|uniref:c-type cytochrome n=1 Tax=Dokdonella sp. TaxID=2291710 RepID=UPI003264A269
MSPRNVLCATLLALGCAAVFATAVQQPASAQEVKEQWNIDAPPPADADTNKQPAVDPHKAAAVGAKPAGGAPAGGTNDHGLTVVKNPYTDNAAMIAEGKELFVSKACSGCHGAGGGGGMCPPVINDTWVYGSDDTTLFNLVKLGSAAMQAKGYTRVGHETIVGEMPPFASVITDDEEWKLIAYVRSKYKGDASLRDW